MQIIGFFAIVLLMNKVELSTKNQVAISKMVLNKVGIKSGDSLTIKKEPDYHALMGSLPGAWSPDPVAKIRKMRDEEW